MAEEIKITAESARTMFANCPNGNPRWPAAVQTLLVSALDRADKAEGDLAKLVEICRMQEEKIIKLSKALKVMANKLKEILDAGSAPTEAAPPESEAEPVVGEGETVAQPPTKAKPAQAKPAAKPQAAPTNGNGNAHKGPNPFVEISEDEAEMERRMDEAVANGIAAGTAAPIQ